MTDQELNIILNSILEEQNKVKSEVAKIAKSISSILEIEPEQTNADSNLHSLISEIKKGVMETNENSNGIKAKSAQVSNQISELNKKIKSIRTTEIQQAVDFKLHYLPSFLSGLFFILVLILSYQTYTFSIKSEDQEYRLKLIEHISPESYKRVMEKYEVNKSTYRKLLDSESPE